jgi:YYY domain-containing protein
MKNCFKRSISPFDYSGVSAVNNVNELPVKNRTQKNIKPIKLNWLWDLLIVVILLIGAYFRFTGINWDNNYHLHPDERFLTMVESAISPVESLGQYFDTANSSLNPNNRGYTFYVYGTLPIFIVRYIGELTGNIGYDSIHLVGRYVSGAFDLGTIFLIFLIGRKLYKNSKLGLLAALFSALAVLQIQLSHYFTVDNVANFFAYAAIYVAVCIMMAEPKVVDAPVYDAFNENQDNQKTSVFDWKHYLFTSAHLGKYALFGILFGMALASKVSIYALAFLLPIAAVVYFTKLSKDSKNNEIGLILRNLAIAGILALITFRIFQPYAFMGPGFFGLKINEGWIASLKELSIISKGDVDVPYALQWARRPITFAADNLVQWGLGLSLGLLGLFGFLWMAWRLIKGDWQKHIVLWGWTAFILVTQSFNWVRSMRYLLPIYPALCLISAWAIFKLWENGAGTVRKITPFHFNWRRVLSVATAIITVGGTAVWAYAFTSIYTRPVTRVAASEWILQNISSAIVMPIKLEDGSQITQLLAYQNTAIINSSQPFIYGFTASSSGTIESLTLEHVLYNAQNNPLTTSSPTLVSLQATLRNENGDVSTAIVQSQFLQVSDARGDAVKLDFYPEMDLKEGQKYELVISVIEPEVNLKLDGGVWINLNDGVTEFRQYMPPPTLRITEAYPFKTNFVPLVSGSVSKLKLNRVVDLLGIGVNSELFIEITDPTNNDQVVGSGEISEIFGVDGDARGKEYWVKLDHPAKLNANQMYFLSIGINDSGSELAIYNDVPAIESTWDDALPLNENGYNLFGYELGLFGNVRNMELYYDDTQTKKDLLYTTLDQSDAIFISSNRQWGTTVRVPERYPLTTEYYRALIGCPQDKDILWCYQVAEPDMFVEELGFKLTAVFQNDPTIAGFKINDQSAEEAFTVYDHPKVLIFEKTEAYDGEKVRAILDEVEISLAVHKTPGQASRFSGNLLLSEVKSKFQQVGGTWNELFPSDSILKKNSGVATVIWYLLITVFGIITYPIVRMVFKGLPDRGYPFSRLTGMLLVAYFTWLAGSTVFPFSRTTIVIVIILLLLISAFLAYKQRFELAVEWHTKKKYFLTVECVMLVLFLVSLGIRYGNPDLWHPWKGGEKPMDLSYFTAVLKSTTFPPYDPWYAGGYINYYYWGFVLVGVPVKLLGIVPAIAYNLIIPTIFALTGLGAFSIGWNLFAKKQLHEDENPEVIRANTFRSNVAGIFSIFSVLIMGNLGTIRMIWQGLQRIVAPGGVIDHANIFNRFLWFFQGLGKFFTGSALPFGIGDWYWIPSRALPNEPITEFPFFTFIYADLHAHLIALPITILIIGWGLGLLLNKWKWNTDIGIKPWVYAIITLAFGGMSVGYLRAANTWDFPTYLLLSCLVILYTIIRYAEIPEKLLPGRPLWVTKTAYVLGTLGLLIGFATLFYLPFTKNFGTSYGSVSVWTNDHSPLSSYLVHWGVQLFIIISWFVWETREWLASTPVSSLKKLSPYLSLMQIVLVLFGLVLVLLTILGVQIAWLAGILGAWALVLIFRPGQPDKKRLVLFITGTALVLTLFVELFVLTGDIGRMNTVFKFYYQAWTFFGLSAAAALIWLIPAVSTRWRTSVSTIWQVLIVLLFFGASLYPITAATDKIRDRMSPTPTNTLNGLEFMSTSHYGDQGVDLDLNQDYQAILWMQQNVIGSPVIVEANTVEYRWGNRYTIYTGLPGVLGWNWHQRQQRGFIDSNGIANRLNDIMNFYSTTDIRTALNFLDQYNVSFIILGQMERAYYPGEGLDKFGEFEGKYWKEVYKYQDTVIYLVTSE